ncbi:MAG TPA: UbiA family prenyltransferase [Candidatus Angelobacter sp.]|nr:UbiA family prenyltransferase [Candidatus Angelobacter sp.]
MPPDVLTRNSAQATKEEGRAICPLCVDLDGTLLRSDLAWECILSILKSRPLLLLRMPWWLLQGRACLKQRLAQNASIDIARLPYRQEIIDLIRERREAGSRTVLVTASIRELATEIADALKCFDAVHASEIGRNLKGSAKAKLLESEFGHGGFDYVGDARADLSVWKICRSAYVVGPQRLGRRAARVAEVARIFPVKTAGFRTWVSALRGHHWFKNLLLFLPVLLAHKMDFRSLLSVGWGFLLFGMCASGLYVLNDLLDLHSDREHPWKHKRPFAAGDVAIVTGLLIGVVLLGVSLSCALLVNPKFAAVLVLYAILTMWYSLRLKKVVILDVFILSSFYTVRICAGAVITSTPLSQWFLSFSLFFFLSLAMAKRYSELLHAGELVKQGNSGRGYLPADRDLILNLGVATGFSAVVIFCLYVNSSSVAALYRTPQVLFLLAPVLAYWLSRLWLKAHRGELYDDPITLALRDRESYAVAVLCVVIMAISMLRVVRL